MTETWISTRSAELRRVSFEFHPQGPTRKRRSMWNLRTTRFMFLPMDIPPSLLTNLCIWPHNSRELSCRFCSLSRHKNRIRSQRLVLVPQSLHAAGKIAHVSFEIELDGCGSLSLPLAVFVLALWRMNIAAVVPATVACFQVCNCSISSVSISRVGHQSLAKVASAGHKPSGLNGMKAGRCSNSGHVAETFFWCRANIGCALLSNFLQLQSHKPTELFFASVWVWF